jgi:hypothetical protein
MVDAAIDMRVSAFLIASLLILAACDDSNDQHKIGSTGSNGCEIGDKFPCGNWLHFANHHCPPGHILLNDYAFGPDRGQICIAYIPAIVDEAQIGHAVTPDGAITVPIPPNATAGGSGGPTVEGILSTPHEAK